MREKDLRSSILQLAVEGRLVPQDATEEPASELMARIRDERRRLVAAGKAKAPKGGESVIYRGEDGSWYERRGKGEPRCIDGEVPFDIPESWEWTRFEAAIEVATNLVNPNDYLTAPHIAPDNIEKCTGVLLPYRTVKDDHVKSNNQLFHSGQILYSKIRPALRKAVIAPCDGLCSADMYPLDSHIDTGYSLLFILSDCFTRAVLETDTRVKMPKTNQAELKKVLLAVPPLAEQRRIVAKVDELMPLVEDETGRGTKDGGKTDE